MGAELKHMDRLDEDSRRLNAGRKSGGRIAVNRTA